MVLHFIQMSLFPLPFSLGVVGPQLDTRQTVLLKLAGKCRCLA